MRMLTYQKGRSPMSLLPPLPIYSNGGASFNRVPVCFGSSLAP